MDFVNHDLPVHIRIDPRKSHHLFAASLTPWHPAPIVTTSQSAVAQNACYNASYSASPLA